MNVQPGSVISNGNGVETPKGKVQQPQIVAERMDELVHLHRRAAEAAVELKEAIDKAAQDSGYKPANVKKLVVARAGEKFEDAKRNVEQQMELFDEVGE